MRKVIIPVIALLVCVAGFFIYNGYADRKAQSERLEEISNQIVQLNIKKSKIEESIEETVKKRDVELRKGSYMVLFFDNMQENLYTDVYPLLEMYNCKGTIVMKDTLLPDGKNCISREHFDFLLSEGWDFAIGCDSSIDMLSKDAPELLAEYLDNYIVQLKKMNIEVPITFCFDKGTYKKAFEDVLKERGFKIIRHFGETGETYASTIGGDFYYVGSGWYCAGSTALESTVVAGYEKNLPFSVSTCRIQEEAIDTKKDCTTIKYRRMLEYLSTYCSDMELCTVTELYEKKLEQLSSLSGVVGEYNAQIAKDEKELEKINKELEALSTEIS